MTREEAVARFEQGAQPKELLAEGGARTSVYKWFNAWSTARGGDVGDVIEVGEVDEEDEGEPAPIGNARTTPKAPAEKPRAAGGRSRPGRTLITEQTAARILFGCSAVVATFSREEIYLLTPAQQAMLAPSFAESFDSVPAPVAKVINQYSAPVVFATTLFSIMAEKQDQIARKRSALNNRQQAAAPPPGAAATTPAPGQGGSPGAGASPVAQTNGKPRVTPVVGQNTGVPEPELSSIFEKR